MNISTKGSTAIKIVAGVLVVAMVVVASLAIAGVFGSNSPIDTVANAEGVTDMQVVRDMAQDTKLNIVDAGGAPITSFDAGAAVRVLDNEGKRVAMTSERVDGYTVCVYPADGWLAGMTYTVNVDSRYHFVGGAYDGLTVFTCTVYKPEVTNVELVDNRIELQEGAYTLVQDEGNASLYYLSVTADSLPDADTVYVIDRGETYGATERYSSYKKAVGYDVAKTATGYTVTVVPAEADDVYKSLDLKKSYTVDENSFDVDPEATAASIMNSDFMAAALDALYGTQAGEIKALSNDYVKVTVDAKPSKDNVTLDIGVTFTVQIKGQPLKIALKIANVITPTFDIHIENSDNGKAFDVAVNMDVKTTATITADYNNSWDQAGASDDLNGVVAKLAAVADEWLGDKGGNPSIDKPYVFAHWTIPVATLPICIEYDMGIEIKASVAGKIGAVATNDMQLTFGVMYNNGKLEGFGNVEDQFKLNTLSMLGTAGAQFGLTNAIGISAYGVVSVDLDVAFGAYADVAGRVEGDIDQIFAGNVNIIPAYYLEAGVYVDIDLQGKVFTFTIGKMNLLSKKYPLYTLGHKYIPVSSTYEGWPTTDGYAKAEDPFQDETLYMNGSYLYLTSFDVMAVDIQSISQAHRQALAYDEFTYAIADESLLVLDDNKLKVTATAPNEFSTTVTVTSKVNKQLSKTLTIVKTPEAPTCAEDVQVFDKAVDTYAVWPVRMNGSKYIGVLAAMPLGEAASFEDGALTVDAAYLNRLDYGVHKLVVESSKGYLNLFVNVVSSAEIAVTNGTVQNFDKNNASSVDFVIDLQGNDIKSFVGGNYTYRKVSNTLSIPASYYMDKDCGNYLEQLVLSNGTKLDLTVCVKDSRLARLNTKTYEYLAGSSNAITLDIDLYNNAITEVTLNGDNITAMVDGTTISALALKNLSAGSYDGTIVAGNQSYTYRVLVGADSMLVVANKHAVFDKNNAADVVFAAGVPQGINLRIDGCNGFSYTADRLVIAADYLAAQKGNAWTGTVVGAENDVVLTIDLTNSAMPSVTVNRISTATEKAVFTWNLQGVSTDSLVIDGLNDDQYVVGNNGLTVDATSLPYGDTEFTVYTPVNSFALTVNRTGTAAMVNNTVVVDRTNSTQEVEYRVETAHETFAGLTVSKADGTVVDIVRTQYRYNDGVLTLANDFVYNLPVGTYALAIQLSESTLSASLTIKGELSTYQSVGVGNGTSASDAYLIYTAEQLASLANSKDDINNKYFKLMADIDMRGVEMKPIGTAKSPFAGGFDGNGYTISNLTITETVKVYNEDGDKIGHAIGLFGYNAGTISNLRLSNPVVSMEDSGSVSAGIVAGRNSGSITNVTIVNGTLTATSKSWLDIKSAYFDVGAVVGYNDGGSIRSISVIADINATVKGLSVMGIQITGRKSLINVGAVVGYFTKGAEDGGRLVKSIDVTASVQAKADSNLINNNGWYGYTDLTADEIAACASRLHIYNK